MSVEKEQVVINQPDKANPINDESPKREKESISGVPLIEQALDLVQKLEIEPRSKLEEITLTAPFSKDEVPPLKIRIPLEVLRKAGNFLAERGRIIKITGGAAVVGAAVVATRKRIKERRKKQEEKPVFLTDEQRQEFSDMYEEYFTRIYSYIYVRMRNQKDAEDMTHKVFMRALRAFPNFETDSSLENSHRAWLYTIAHNLVANVFRDRSRRPLDDTFEEWSVAVPPEEPPEGVSKEKIRLLQTIHSLKHDEQFLIWLKFEGLSNLEIGQILGRTERAIKSKYFRILVKIKEKLAQLEQEESSTD